MKITVVAEDLPFPINIRVPNIMFASSLITQFVDLPIDLDMFQGRDFARCLKWMRKHYPGVPLVEVEASTGERVTIMP